MQHTYPNWRTEPSELVNRLRNKYLSDQDIANAINALYKPKGRLAQSTIRRIRVGDIIDPAHSIWVDLMILNER